MQNKHWNEINEQNKRIYRTLGSYCGELTCTICNRQVPLDDAYSNRGDRYICFVCKNKLAWFCNMQQGEFLTKYVWKLESED